MKDFEGACAVITGGGGGLGAGIALALAERGTNVVVADWDKAAAEASTAAVEALGVQSMAAHVDVSDPAVVEHLADVVYERFGSVQLLVNNAAVWQQRPAHQMRAEDLRWLFSVNVEGPLNGIRAFAPRMLEQSGERHISITSSTNGLWPLAGQAAYNASKYALVGLAETFEAETRGSGLEVSVICPGPMATGQGHNSRPPSLGGQPSTSEAMSVTAELSEMLATWGIQQPTEAGHHVVCGIERGEFYILTHAKGWRDVEARFGRLRGAFERRRTWD